MSVKGPGPVREFALLAALGLDPPYVLVGHSIGGRCVELYARTHPEEVAGVVFVDARHADFSARCLAERALRAADPAAVQAELRRALWARGAEPVDSLPDVLGERDAILALDAATLGDVARRHLIAAPVIVLVGDRSQLEAVFETVAPERRLREIDEHGRVD